MTDEERSFAEGLLKVAAGAEHALRRELTFTRSNRKRRLLVEELEAVTADVRRLREVLNG